MKPMNGILDILIQLKEMGSKIEVLPNGDKFGIVLDPIKNPYDNSVFYILSREDVYNLFGWYNRVQKMYSADRDAYFLIEKYKKWPRRIIYNTLDWNILDTLTMDHDNDMDDVFYSNFTKISDWRKQAIDLLDWHNYNKCNDHRLAKAVYHKRVVVPAKVIEDVPLTTYESNYAKVIVSKVNSDWQVVKSIHHQDDNSLLKDAMAFV